MKILKGSDSFGERHARPTEGQLPFRRNVTKLLKLLTKAPMGVLEPFIITGLPFRHRSLMITTAGWPE